MKEVQEVRLRAVDCMSSLYSSSNVQSESIECSDSTFLALVTECSSCARTLDVLK